MNRARQNAASSDPYATVDDFCQVFAVDMGPLYCLSFLLTGSHQKAERCFISALEECIHADHVFKEWVRSKAKRAVVQSAIRMLQPRPKERNSSFLPMVGSATNGTRGANPDVMIRSVLALDDFDRVVFVSSILEHYTEYDCALLLACSRRQIQEARARALGRVAQSNAPAHSSEGCSAHCAIFATDSDSFRGQKESD